MRPMKKLQVVALAVLVSSANSIHAQEKISVANIDYSLTSKEVASLAENANAGDGEAAMRISNSYLYGGAGKRQRNNREQALLWALIGAENGDSKAKFRAYQLLRTSEEKNKRIRALFWLQQAAKDGNEDGVIGLKYCPTIDSIDPMGGRCFGPGSDE